MEYDTIIFFISNLWPEKNDNITDKPLNLELERMSSYLLMVLTKKQEVDAIIRDTIDKVLVLHFGRASDPVCLQLNVVVCHLSLSLSLSLSLFEFLFILDITKRMNSICFSQCSFILRNYTYDDCFFVHCLL